MAKQLDLEEQEQLAQLKHWWSRNGNSITWVLIVVLASFAGWNGWQYWERKTALQAAALYDELERAVSSREGDRIQRVWADMQATAGRSAQAQQAALLVARALFDDGKATEAKAALSWLVSESKDDALVSVARLRLAGLELDAAAPEAALKWLDVTPPPDFAGLFADRRGDAFMVQDQRDRARAEYERAHAALTDSPDYRRLVEAKLAALGVNMAQPTPNQETPR
jgi:predicted negative regulator of RcsB-dependent stress response